MTNVKGTLQPSMSLSATYSQHTCLTLSTSCALLEALWILALRSYCSCTTTEESTTKQTMAEILLLSILKLH